MATLKEVVDQANRTDKEAGKLRQELQDWRNKKSREHNTDSKECWCDPIVKDYSWYRLKKLLCYFFGHYGDVDREKLVGRCKRCHRWFRVTYDMTYGDTVWEEEVRCDAKESVLPRE